MSNPSGNFLLCTLNTDNNVMDQSGPQTTVWSCACILFTITTNTLSTTCTQQAYGSCYLLQIMKMKNTLPI